MAFWNRKKAPEKAPLEPAEEPVERSEFRSTAGRKRPSGDASFAMEVKLLAIDALDSGLSAPEVAAIIGVSDSSVYQWRKHFKEKGIDGLVRSPSSHRVRRCCERLEEKIVEFRKTHPDKGVRKVRDELRRTEALSVSAETVRQVVNDHGLGNTPPKPKRRPPPGPSV